MKKYFNYIILSMHHLGLIADWQWSVMVEVWKDHNQRQNFRMGKVTFKQSGWISKKRLPPSFRGWEQTSPPLLCCQGGSGLGKQEPLVKPQARDISRKCIHKSPGQVFAACDFPFTLAAHTPMYTIAPEGCGYGFILPSWKLLRPSGVLYQQQCQLAGQLARHPCVPHVQPEQAHANKTACTVSCHQERLSLLQDGTAVYLTVNSFT